MKLSKKINYILLPVIMVIFSIAGLYSYSLQKIQITKSVSEMFRQELTHINDDLLETANELDLYSQLLLSSDDMSFFLNSREKDNYYIEKQLIEYINGTNITRGDVISVGLLDKDKNELFYVNFENPFSRMNYSNDLLNHLAGIEDKIKNSGLVHLSPAMYRFSQNETGGEFVLIRTFSPDQPISSTSFSYGHEIYTAVITLGTHKLDEHLSTLKAPLGENAKLEVFSKGAFYTINNVTEKIIEIQSELSYGLSISNELWDIELSTLKTDLRKMYSPFKLIYIFVVVVVTLTTFFILKWLIIEQIINPVARLTTQVENVGSGKKIRLCRSEGDDEVSLLTNKYLDLITELNDLAKRDHLTGLPNRNQFNTDLERFVKQSLKNNELCAVIYFDLDNFKSVNDIFGHNIGDEILQEFSKRLVESYVDLDWDNIEVSEFEFARISGDEFTIIVSGIKDIEILALFSQNIIDIFEGGFRFNGNLFDLGASIGIAVCPNDAQDANTLVNYADMAMYSAKKERKSGYRFYSSELDLEIKRHEMIANNLRKALEKDEFRLVYMPIFDSQSGGIHGAEALLRATSEELLSIGPAEFIPVAETSGIIKGIDYWVIESSFRQLSVWIEEFNFDGVLAINFSSWQLKNPEFVPMVAKLLEQYDVPPAQVELEITETCFVPGESRNVEMLTELHQLGVKLSLDDFGTGFTAFSQLMEYPVDTLKVDQMFVNAIDAGESENNSLVDMIVEVAKLYDLNVVAEGVETKEQLEHIRKIGGQKVQGFLLSKPLTKEQFIELWHSKVSPCHLELFCAEDSKELSV